MPRSLLFLLLAIRIASAQGSVEALPPKAEWSRFTIMVWQYRHDVRKQVSLYESLGLRAFHIDRGAESAELVRFAKERGWPYYVDHAADKGILHLTKRTGLETLSKARGPVPRPHSLASAKTLRLLEGHLRRNILATRGGPVLAYAFDDEISLGRFASPVEVDASPDALRWFRRWIATRYPDIGALNRQWGTGFNSFEEIGAQGFESLRAAHRGPRFSRWNLSPWMDWRSGMDELLAETLRHLVRFSNGLDPHTPAGFVGGSHPAPWGGFDYERLARSVQWMEAYDVCGSMEILRSLWDASPTRPRVQTWFSRGELREDSWFLWYHLLHGARGVVAWPETGGSSWFGKPEAPEFLRRLAPTLKEVQGPLSETLLHPDTRAIADPVGLLYSPPSVQASWVLDAQTHGRTWPRRSNSLDAANQSAGWNRIAWRKLLEDLGHQPRVVTPSGIRSGALDGLKLLVLPRTLALSDEVAARIRAFVAAGGRVIADHLCGLLDEHGRGRSPGALDELFAIRRREERGILGGRVLCELDGERYRRPFRERLRYEDAIRFRGLPVYERGTRASAKGVTDEEDSGVLVRARHGKGRTLYLNLSPLPYAAPGGRWSPEGAALFALIGRELRDAGLHPVLELRDTKGKPVPGIEILRWSLPEKRRIVAVVANPILHGAQDTARGAPGVSELPRELILRFPRPYRIRNLRSGEILERNREFRLGWIPWEALLLELEE